MRILILSMVVASCSKPNPDACCTTADQCLMFGLSGVTPCDTARVCNMDGNCVVPMCKIDADCSSDGSMVCDMYGQCEPAGGNPQHTLTVQVGGSGAGAITSTPPGIACSSGTCTGTFDTGTQVQLTQSETTGSFLGWAYGCRGTDACMVTMSADQRVGALFGTPGEGLWAKQVAAGGNDSGRGVAPTADGDFIAVGAFAGTLHLDAITLTSGDDTIAATYVAKLDGWTGGTLWARSFPLDTAVQVAVDSDGQIYVLGQFTGTVDLGGGNVLNSAGGIDTYVVKLSATGDLTWAYRIGGSDDDRAYALVVGGGFAVVVSANSTAAAIAAVNTSAGTLKWAKAPAPGTNFGLAIDASNVFLSGTLSSAYDFGSGTVTPIGTSDAFVARYVIATGALTSVDHYGASSSSQAGFGVAKDVAGNTLVSGSILAGSDQLYVTKFSPAGAVAWTQTFNRTVPDGNAAISSIAFAESGDIMMAGLFCGTVTIGVDEVGPGCSTQDPRFGSFITSLRNSNGAPLSSTVLVPDARVEGLTKAATDGRLYATGLFSSSVTFPTEVLTVAPAVGKFDGFVTAFAP